MLMTILGLIQEVIGVIAMAGVLWRMFVEHRKFVRYRGRHVSKGLGRLLGYERMMDAELWLLLTWVAFIAASWISGAAVLLLVERTCSICWIAWLADDVWFTDDDMRKRWDGVKAKLRKCKPVMKRAVQRWKPQTPRVPVPA